MPTKLSFRALFGLQQQQKAIRTDRREISEFGLRSGPKDFLASAGSNIADIY